MPSPGLLHGQKCPSPMGVRGTPNSHSPPAAVLGLPLLGDQVTNPLPSPQTLGQLAPPRSGHHDSGSPGASASDVALLPPLPPQRLARAGGKDQPHPAPEAMGWGVTWGPWVAEQWVPQKTLPQCQGGRPVGAQCEGLPVWGPRAPRNSHRRTEIKASHPHRAAVSNSSSSAVELGRGRGPLRGPSVQSSAWGAPRGAWLGRCARQPPPGQGYRPRVWVAPTAGLASTPLLAPPTCFPKGRRKEVPTPQLPLSQASQEQTGGPSGSSPSSAWQEPQLPGLGPAWPCSDLGGGVRPFPASGRGRRTGSWGGEW